MAIITRRAKDVFAPTDSNGQKRRISAAETQQWGIMVEQISSYGGVARATLAQLQAVTPDAGEYPVGVVFADGTDANNGYYIWTGSAWSKQRDFFDTLAVLENVSGTNTLTADASSGVSPSTVQAVIMTPANSNTGAVTLSINGGDPDPVNDGAGNPLEAGELETGIATLLFRVGAEWRQLFPASILAQMQAILDQGAGLVQQVEDAIDAFEMPVMTRQRFPGDGVTVAFTLSAAPLDNANVLVFVDGIEQPGGVGSDWSISGTTLTFTTPPPGDGIVENISVVFGVGLTNARSGNIRRVSNITALKALDPSLGRTAWVEEQGREQMWSFRDGNFSSHVSEDPSNTVVAASNHVSSSLGAWFAVRSEMIRASDDGTEVYSLVDDGGLEFVRLRVDPTYSGRARLVNRLGDVRDLNPHPDFMYWVTDPDAADWSNYFNQCVTDVIAASGGRGARIMLPNRDIPVHIVAPILSDGIFFEGQIEPFWNSVTWAGTRIRGLSGSGDCFAWGTTVRGYDGGGFSRVMMDMSARTGGFAVKSTWMRTWSIEETHIYNPANGIYMIGGVDNKLIRAHVEEYEGEGVVSEGTDTLRADRLLLEHVIVAGTGSASDPTSTGPGIRLQGYLHTVDATHVALVKCKQGILADSPYSDPDHRPHFVTFDNLQVDYTKDENVLLVKARDVKISNSYLNGTVQAKQLSALADVAGLTVSATRFTGAGQQAVNFAGQMLKMTVCSLQDWNVVSAANPAIELAAGFRNATVMGCTVGKAEEKTTSQSGAGTHAVRIGTGTGVTTLVGNKWASDLHATKIQNNGSGTLVDVANTTQ